MDWPLRLTRRLFLALSGGAAVALRPVRVSAKEADDSALSAEGILRRVAETYRTCKTYQDSGTQTILFRGLGPRTNTRHFTTAFIRPDRIHFVGRYRYHEHMPWRHNIAWASGNEVRWWWADEKEPPPSKPPLERPTTIVRALQRTAGSAAPDVAILLFPGQPGEWSRLTELLELRRLEDAQLDDVSCFRIEGRRVPPWEANPVEKERHRRAVQKIIRAIEQRGDRPMFRPPDPDTVKNSPRVIWIDRAAFLVRRIEDRTQFETFSTESTTTYEPVVDAPVSDEQLAYVEPVYSDPPRLHLEPAPEPPVDAGGFVSFVSQSRVRFTA